MKHKFKLTRLWVASLLLLFGVSQPSWAAYYLAGSFPGNNWNAASNDWKFDSNGYLTKTLAKSDNYEFKVTNGSWDNTWGSWNFNRSYNSGTLTKDGSNCNFVPDVSGEYTFHFDGSKLTITYPHDWTIKGSFDGWKEHHFNTGTNDYTFNLTEDTEYEFGVVHGTDDSFYTLENHTYTKSEAAGSTKWTLYTGQHNNLKIKTSVAGDYKFVISWSGSDPQIKVVYPAAYNVTYNGNGNTSGSVPTDSKDYAKNATVTVKSNSGSLAKTGYTFNGWNTNNTGTGTHYAAGTGTFSITANTTLYAEWTANQYTVTLDAKDGTGGSTSVTATYGAAMPSATMPTKTGYTFGGYYDGEGGAGTQYYTSAGASARNWDKASTATLYAKWTVKSYDITYSPSSAPEHCTYSNMAATGTYGQSASFTITPEANYEVTITVKDASDNPVAYTKNGNTYTITSMPASNVIVSVTCNYVTQKYAVTFGVCTSSAGKGSVTVNGDSNSPVEVIENTQANILATGATGYEWEGWYSDQAGNTKIDAATANPYQLKITAPISVYAKFKAKTTTVTLDAQGGTGGTPSVTATYDANMPAITVPTKTGYNFAGYYDETSGAGTQYYDNTGASARTWNKDAANVTLYAHWTEKTITLTPVSDNSTMGTVSGGGSVGIVTPVTITASKNSGYKFGHWNLSSNLIIQGGGKDTDESITVKTDGTGESASATAVFEEDLTSTWYVRGDSPYFCGWVTSADCMLKKESGHSTSNDVYYTVTLPAKTNTTFKIWDETNSRYYGATTDGGNYWITSTSGQIQLNYGNDYHNLEIRGTVAGDYLIHFNTSTKKVEVTWPEKYFIAGNTQLTGKNWDVQGTEMTNRSYTFSNLAANTDYRFRITDGTWDQTWGYTDLADGSDSHLAELDDNNIAFTLAAAGSVTVTLSTNKKITITTTSSFVDYRFTDWKIGGMKSGDWSDRVFMKKSGELDQSIAYYEVELTKDDYVFKIKNPSGTYLGNEGEITGNVNDWEFYQYYADGETEKPNCRLKATVAGIYIFKLDFTTPSVPKVSVSYPRGEGYTTTITTEGEGKVQKDGVDVTEVPLYEVYGTALTAVPNDGYHFVGWTVTGKVFIDSNNKLTDSPAYFYASGEGTIKATFAKNPTIYFNNTMSKIWGADKMYVYFYSTDYWDESEYGSGSKDILAGPFAMTQIPRTNIWEYTYDPTAAPFNRTNIKGVVFSDENMPGYEHFQNCSATYRMDYSNGCANMFVLNPQQDVVLKNVSAKYYKKGFWRNYNSLTSKMYLNIWDCDNNQGIGSYELVTDEAGNEAFSATVNLSSNKRYNVYVGNCTGSNFSQKVEITSDNCSGFDLYEYESIDDKTQLAYLTTKSSGDYVFTLTFDDAHMLFSVEYPIMLDDYRVRMGTSPKYRYSNIIRSTEESGMISMFLNEGTNTLTYQKVTNVDVTPIVWTADGTINVNVEHSGVYTMTLSRDKQITNVQPYTGEYYVRTDCAQGGWNEYKTNDNNLMRFTDRNPKFVINPSEGFNYYYCRWNTNEGGNVRFVVANEINACISDTMKADAMLDDTEFLKGMANIRFGYNSNTNALSRAYISGAYDDARYMQIRSNDSKLFEYTQEETKPVITAKSFADENDWTYTMDVLADGGAQVAVSAFYNNKYQFFVGTGNVLEGTVSTTEQLLEAGTKQHLRLVYDFKTDRLISGWTPSGDITETIILDADMLLVREGQGNAAQIRITSTGVEIQKIKTIYAVLQLNKSTMIDGLTQTDSIYARNIYWFSLPFDVAVNDIFGIDGYGTKWVLQYYDGDLRSRIGFFAETETFWTYLGINDTVKANVGYALCLDPDYFDDADDAIWANGRQSVSFYFPSADRDLKIVGNGAKTVAVPQHECTIDRTFGEHNEKNHKITDTDWNVIGSPAFQDLKGTGEMCTMQALYQWNPATNGYNVATVKDFDFLTTHAYLVQFHGDINWQNASIINPTVAPAPRYAYADEKNYTVELMFYFGDQWDRAYVALKDNAKADFVLSEDLTKMMNSGQPNIYSYAGAYDVAYNATAFENQMVNLGVIARKNGSYTFAMPKDFSGKAVLVDLESGEATDLNLSDYTVELNKGTYNNRFQLLLEVEAKAPTNMNPTKGEWSEDGKTKKLFINDNIYLINGGRIYNVLGARP